MSKKRYFDSNFWNDTWVENLTKEERLFFIYLITNDNVSIAGVYEIPMRKMSIESDFTKSEVTELLEKMKSKVKYVDGWIVLRNAIKSQNYKNDKIRRGIKAILESCPVDLLEHVSFPQDFDTEIERVEPQPTQQGLFDESSMRHEETYMTHVKYNVIKLNRIKLNTNENAAEAAESSKEFSATQKRNYAKASQADREQATRARQSFKRKPSPPGKLSLEEIDKAYDRRTMER